MRVPTVGESLNVADAEMIYAAYSRRRQNFPDEPEIMTLTLILFNIGDRFAPVSCIEEEWEGLKSDIPPGEGIPKCPNGHPLVQGPGLRLGWMEGQ